MNFESGVRQVIKKLRDRHPRFVPMTQRILIYTPVFHHSNVLVLEARARQGYFTVEWRINTFCEPKSKGGLRIGRTFGLIGRSTRFKPEGRGGLFEIDDPTMADDFVDQVETKVLPIFHSLDTFRKVAEFEMSHPDLHVTKTARWKALMNAALGDIPTAQKLWLSCNTDEYSWLVPRMTEEWYDYKEWCRIPGPLMKGDKAALVKLLHEWEAREIRGTKVERYWTPTPFPLELME